jgi:hypothetical protein
MPGRVPLVLILQSTFNLFGAEIWNTRRKTEKGKKMRHPDKTIVFETKAEFDAFKKGFLRERDEYEADLITSL